MVCLDGVSWVSRLLRLLSAFLNLWDRVFSQTGECSPLSRFLLLEVKDLQTQDLMRVRQGLFLLWFLGGWGTQSSPPAFPFSSWAPDTKEGDVFCVLGPGAVATVYICALPLLWRSPASTIGCPVFSLLFGLSNLDCSLKNSVVLWRPLRGFRRTWFQLCLLRSELDGWFCFSISWQVFFFFYVMHLYNCSLRLFGNQT